MNAARRAPALGAGLALHLHVSIEPITIRFDSGNSLLMIPAEFRDVCRPHDPRDVLTGLMADVLGRNDHGQDARVSARRWLHDAFKIAYRIYR